MSLTCIEKGIHEPNILDQWILSAKNPLCTRVCDSLLWKKKRKKKRRFADELESFKLDSRFDLKFADEAYRACYSLCGVLRFLTVAEVDCFDLCFVSLRIAMFYWEQILIKYYFVYPLMPKQRVQKNLAVLNKRTKGGCSCMCMLLSVVGIVVLIAVIFLLIKYL